MSVCMGGGFVLLCFCLFVVVVVVFVVVVVVVVVLGGLVRGSVVVAFDVFVFLAYRLRLLAVYQTSKVHSTMRFTRWRNE